MQLLVLCHPAVCANDQVMVRMTRLLAWPFSPLLPWIWLFGFLLAPLCKTSARNWASSSLLLKAWSLAEVWQVEQLPAAAGSSSMCIRRCCLQCYLVQQSAPKTSHKYHHQSIGTCDSAAQLAHSTATADFLVLQHALSQYFGRALKSHGGPFPPSHWSAWFLLAPVCKNWLDLLFLRRNLWSLAGFLTDTETSSFSMRSDDAACSAWCDCTTCQ